jgi:hypothetical protein
MGKHGGYGYGYGYSGDYGGGGYIIFQVILDRYDIPLID